jgi:hypothetical protein
MAPESRVTVCIDRPSGTSLGMIMSDIRTWLDSNKIQPVDFKPTVGADGIGFDISFHTQEEAARFISEFGDGAAAVGAAAASCA